MKKEDQLQTYLDQLTPEGLGENQSQERILFLSVILQALLDATKTESNNEPDEAVEARRAAQAWFFASIGVTSEDFNTVCDMAGVDPELMRGFAFKILRSKEISYVRKRINAILSSK